MSGGAYDYLYLHSDDLFNRRRDLEAMAERLEGLPWAAAAAADTRTVLCVIKKAEALAEGLAKAWHAIEWWDSSDWSEEHAREDVEAYQSPLPLPLPDPWYRLINMGDGSYELRPLTQDPA